MTPLLQNTSLEVSAWLAATTVQSSVLIAVVWTMDRALGGKAGPRFRSALWWVVMVKLVIPPTLALPTSAANIVGLIGWGPAEVVTGTGPAASQEWRTAAFIVWAVGVALAACLAMVRYRRVNAWREGAADELPPEWLVAQTERVSRRAGLSRAPRVVVCAGQFSPAVVGAFRPVILMPAEAVRSASRVQIRHMLMHEIMHVRRGDVIANAVLTILKGVYWFHPGVHLARSRLALLCEMNCDDAVCRLLGRSASRYRVTLLTMARTLLERPAAHGALAFLRRRSQIVQRLECLRRPPVSGLFRRRVAPVLTVALLVTCFVPLGAPALAPGKMSSAGQTPDDVPGCLQQRYLFHRELARWEAGIARRALAETRG